MTLDLLTEMYDGARDRVDWRPYEKDKARQSKWGGGARWTEGPKKNSSLRDCWRRGSREIIGRNTNISLKNVYRRLILPDFIPVRSHQVL